MRISAGLLAAGVVSLIVGCTSATAPSFGAHYSVLLEPDAPRPQLAAAELAVTVSYGGCRGGHDFVLGHRTRSDTADVWLRKVTANEPCDMLVIERRTFALPERVLTAAAVVLLAPDSVEIQLRP